MNSLTSVLYDELSRRLALGHSAEQISREMDYPQQFIEQQLVREDFLERFAANHPEAFTRWRTIRDEENVGEEVQHFLSMNALHNAKKMQELADSGMLKPGEEKGLRETLLKFSGKIKEDQIVEVVKISAAHLAAIAETAKEID